MPSNRRTPFQTPLFRALGEACRAVVGLRRRALWLLPEPPT